MKYIRTKDGIMTYDELQEYGSKQWLNCKKVEIIKQADNLEELCDEFVIDDDVDDRVFKDIPYRHISNLSYIQKSKIYLRTICYGAIWTDKGLIYVAKMNDKGYLELL